MKFTKIVLKYKNPDQWDLDHGHLYVGRHGKTEALSAIEFSNEEYAKEHSKYTAEPTEVKILTITVEEQDV